MTLTPQQAIIRLMDKCDVYFEESLISKEQIVRKYAKHYSESFGRKSRFLSVAQHTGSVCFDVISVLVAILGCLAFNETDNDDVICSFEDGQIVLLSSKGQQERCLWRGFAKGNRTGFEVSDFECAEYAVLEQPSSSTKHYVSKERWNYISPYKGLSTRTDGRGIKKVKTNRNDFVSYLFDVPVTSVPSVLGVSTVIIIERKTFKRIVDGVRVEYGNGKSIDLLELVTASYYTSNLEEQRYGVNPGRIEPSLKITSRISTARELVLDKNGNKTVGFMVLGTDITGRNAELAELLERKSLKFSVLTAAMDSVITQKIIATQNEASIFVCTKNFLLQNANPPEVKNPITLELNSQVKTIINKKTIPIGVESICSWQEIKTLKTALNTIKCSDIKSEEKDDFIITAYALINLIQTGLFPLGRLNTAIESAELDTKATAPSVKLNELWRLADKPSELVEEFIIVADTIDRLYHSVLEVCPKHDALVSLIAKYPRKKIAVVVPKSYYIDLLKADALINEKCNVIVTANQFNSLERYEVVIVAGDFCGTRFNPFTCRAASNVFVLLHDGEKPIFRHKKLNFDSYEKSIDARLGIESDEADEDGSINDFRNDEVEAVVAQDGELNQYINTITFWDMHSFVQKMCGCSGNAPTSEIYAIGNFRSGEKILFTRYYQAVVFNEVGGSVKEKDVDSLRAGDIVVFAKRDDKTKNMVDYIYGQLHRMGRLSDRVIDATEKASYWKLALRKYKEIKDLSYRDLAKELRANGSSIQEMSVRQWLTEESHIIGPREANTLVHIANITQDPFLIEKPHAYFEACEIVRKQRKNILKLIGKVIVDRFNGLKPTEDKLWGVIFENVDDLSETLRLEDISILDKPVFVPINFANRPISDREVVL